MARLDPQIRAHLEWLGFIQPTGLVVSAPALVRAGAILNRADAEGQRLLRECIEERELDAEGPVPFISDFRHFARTVLEWNFSPRGYAGTEERPIPCELEVALPDYGETFRPDFAVIERDPQEGTTPWQLLVRTLEPNQDFDRIAPGRGKLEASSHGRMERLLRQTGVPAGILFNGHSLRLISAPRGESSGWMDFHVADMVQTAGRPLCTALRLLLRQSRLLSLPRQQRFATLLESSRKFQNEVSERLAEQVLHALYELLRGFQAAQEASGGRLLHDPVREDPDQVYRALLTVILRLVFLLYAEERDMLPKDETWLRYYSLAGLYERLREDASLFPDTMDQRFGAWSQLLVLFRMIFDGAESEAMRLPRRHGVLFDPNRFPFLEGRVSAGGRQITERVEAPLVPDGPIYRALENLLLLDGERISYRALDVEQIGSVYETMMGFRLEITTGRSLAIKAAKKHGAPTTIDLDALLEVVASKRRKWVEDRAVRKLSNKVRKDIRGAATLEDIHAGLMPVVDQRATPDLVPKGAMVLQPSDERRRSGSHYTPRELTEPIVRTTLEPILTNLRGHRDGTPTPEQILNLKVCDPAMGSGAFLVEACRQLGDALIESWNVHDQHPKIPEDEDEIIYARRLVAQRCLYGVDRNPVAVDLAKVSLWLVTLARDHALTFVDHALRHGDSLVGLSRKQIEAFHWDVSGAVLKGLGIREPLDRVSELRRKIRDADETISGLELRDLWDEAQYELSKVRLLGDLVLAAFFEAKKPREKKKRRNAYASIAATGGAERYRSVLEQCHSEKLLTPFHWEIEFTEVFDRETPGFDAITGNPPFLGGKRISTVLGSQYRDWLATLHTKSNSNTDLSAHFFRRAFNLLREDGALGLIATNTIAQGDTRSTGLQWICKNSGSIYCARRRIKWPGEVGVVVSVIHIVKGAYTRPRRLDGREVETISAFLFHAGGHDDPAQLAANAGKSFIGMFLRGMGFTFDDTDSKGVATSLSEMRDLVEKNPRNQDVIQPYIGGKEVNTSPTHAHYRYAINFGWRDEEECRARWPDLVAIVEQRVRPARERIGRSAIDRGHNQRWWLYERDRPQLRSAIASLDRVLVISRISNAFAFTFLPTGMIYNEKIVVFPFAHRAPFAVLQSRIHEIWARFFSSTLQDNLQYTPSDCFGTYPFADGWEMHPVLEAAGAAYYDFRAALMIQHNEGLTKTYNRFHDPDERDPGIITLRELHAEMDRTVLDLYGWSNIPTDCEFLLEYEIDEEEWGRRKKPWRYRWPDKVRDEVLARLLKLNAERAKEEARAGKFAGRKNKKIRRTKAKARESFF